MILIFGPPGSGKGTQAKLLQDEGLAKWYSTGQLLRESVKDETELSKMFKGELVSDEYITQTLLKALVGQTDKERPILLDGYPRSLIQVDWLFSKDNPGRVSGIIQLVAPQTVLEERLIIRGKKEARSDDRLETIKNRFEVYRNESLPAIENLKERGIQVIEVNGDQPVEGVHKECRAALIKLLNNANQN